MAPDAQVRMYGRAEAGFKESSIAPPLQQPQEPQLPCQRERGGANVQCPWALKALTWANFSVAHRELTLPGRH